MTDYQQAVVRRYLGQRRFFAAVLAYLSSLAVGFQADVSTVPAAFCTVVLVINAVVWFAACRVLGKALRDLDRPDS